ncbi:hypothetical protein [Deinococcus pimensis]|uniref:hypothetical protein n=1 Tax=Deinococcus pimensis TaxID=309888 RepID=UPI00048A3C8F|nr:hypothetical protein [Deinococcus pimensis]
MDRTARSTRLLDTTSVTFTVHVKLHRGWNQTSAADQLVLLTRLRGVRDVTLDEATSTAVIVLTPGSEGVVERLLALGFDLSDPQRSVA